MDHLLKKLASALALAGDSLPAHLKSKGTPLHELAAFQARRLGHDQPYLVVGLLGPNNAGKSTFFTKFTECDISPPHADGGFTRHLAAAAHPLILKRLIEENPLSEFDVVETSAPPDDAQRRTVPSNTLFLAPSPRTPQHLVIIDSPDFDGIDDAHHKISAGLSRIADLIVCVVTKHTYSNATVRRVMDSAIDHGRPYVVVYNEAPKDTRIAARHLESLIDSFKSKPQGRFYAPLDLDVQSDPKALKVLRIDDDEPFDPVSLSVDDVKRLLVQANASKLAKLAEGVDDMINAWAEHAGQVERFLDGITKAAGQFGRSVAVASYPIEPLRDTVIEILNERSLWHRRARIPVQSLAKGVSWTSKQVWRGAGVAGEWALREGSELMDRKWGTHLRERISEHHHTEESPAKDTCPEAGLIDKERKKFDAEWTRFVKAVEARLGRSSLQPHERAAFEEEFHPNRLSGIKEQILEDAADDLIPKDYLEFCRREVREALDSRGNNQDLQALATAFAATPAAGGIVVAYLTGGFGGGDWFTAAAATLTTPLFNKLIQALGKDTARRVQNEWIKQRGERIEKAIERSLAPKICRAWENEISQARTCIPQLKECVRGLEALVKEVEYER